MKLRNLIVVSALAVAFVAVPAAQAQTGVLFVKNNFVGIGESNPAFPLHIVKTTAGNQQMIRLENNGAPFMVYENTDTSETWALQPTTTGTTFTITNLGVPGGQMLLTKTGNMTIQGSLTEGSSRAIKRDFELLDRRAVLDQVLEMEIPEWSYDAAPEARHIGPVAEDFHAAFGLGTSPTGVAPRDVAGVALLAVQGLNEVVQEKDQQIEQLSGEVAELRALVEKLADR